MNEVIQTYTAVAIPFGIIVAIAFYFWLGYKLTCMADDNYGHGIWNLFSVPLLIYMAIVWVTFFFKTSFGQTETALAEGNFFMMASTVAVFIVLWIYNSVKTSFLFGFFVSLYQSSVSFLVFVMIMMTFFGFSPFGGSSKK